MTDPEARQRAVLEALAARLELARADQAIKRYLLASKGRLSQGTVARAFRGENLTVSTLVTLADGLDCDVKIELVKREGGI